MGEAQEIISIEQIGVMIVLSTGLGKVYLPQSM